MRTASRYRRKPESNEGEFLWLISLSDLMMLLFVFFVLMFSFASTNMGPGQMVQLQNLLDAKSARAGTPLDLVQQQLLKWVTDRNLLQSVEVKQKEDSLVLEIKEKMLFDSGQWALRPEAESLLPDLREALAKIPAPYRIGIEGHSDDAPTNSKTDNWHLSTLRALAVHQSLHLPAELESRAVILGYGDTRPLVPNRDDQGRPIPENQAQNRRVTLRIF